MKRGGRGRPAGKTVPSGRRQGQASDLGPARTYCPGRCRGPGLSSSRTLGAKDSPWRCDAFAPDPLGHLVSSKILDPCLTGSKGVRACGHCPLALPAGGTAASTPADGDRGARAPGQPRADRLPSGRLYRPAPPLPVSLASCFSTSHRAGGARPTASHLILAIDVL